MATTETITQRSTEQWLVQDLTEDGKSNSSSSVKSPPPTFQTIGEPTSKDYFPDKGNDESTGRGRTLEQMLVEDDESDERHAFEVKETWKNPRINLFRGFAVLLAMFNLGIHDAAYGPLIPTLEEYYGLNYTTVSLVFLATFPGYLLAAFSSDRLHLRFGRRGVAGFASICRIATYVAMVCHPPWPVIIVLLVFAGWGNGLLDAAWNAWAGDLARPNEMLGILHALYGLGAAVAPLMASALVDRANKPWFDFYYIPLALASAELVTGVASFWKENAAEFKRKTVNAQGEGSGRTRAAIKSRVTCTLAVFLLFYVGAEVSLSGWVVTFMQRVRHAPAFDSSLTSTGFWLGVTVGRLVLGFITPLIGERWAITGYLLAGMALELVFWLVPQFVVSAVAVALLGFFLGPMFPAAIVVLSKLLPKHLHVGAISFVAAIGMGGAAVLPFAVGAIANAAGVKVLQPIILAILAILILMWLILPKVPKDKRSE